MKYNSKIYIAGHKGLVGSAIVRKLRSEGYKKLIVRTFDELDLRIQKNVNRFFSEERPEYIFLAAARVGGIQANIEFPANFLYDNLMISANIIHAAHIYKIKKLIFLGSSCIYPRLCPQPIKEKYLLTSELEKTNEPYAIAKIAGIKLCQSYNRQYGTKFISCMPTNLYGPNDNFNLHSSHVIPALIAKIYDAHISSSEKVVVWGSGEPRREFLFVDDLADALFFLMQNYDYNEIINIGAGVDLTIYELANLIKEEIGFKGELFFDLKKPGGVPQKLLDVEKLNALGWHAKTSLKVGLRTTIDWYKSNCFVNKNAKMAESTKQKEERC